MADVKWIKIVTDIFDDEKILLIEALPDRDAIIVCWFKLLCLAGKQNNHGVFLLNDRIAYTDEMLAAIFRRPISTVRAALETFQRFGMVEILDGVITIPNWDRHQSLEAYEKKKEYDRLYQARKREHQREIAAGKATENDNRTTARTSIGRPDIEEEREEDIDNTISSDSSESDLPVAEPKKNVKFESWWSHYPKKVGKQAALKAFQRIKVPVDQLIAAVEAQKRSEQWTRDNGRYIPNPATWLNQGRWEDEIQQASAQPGYAQRDLDSDEMDAIRRMMSEG